MSDHLWFPEITDSMARSSHLFVHYGAFHRVDEDGSALASEMEECGYAPSVLQLRWQTNFATPADGVDVVLLVDMETLINRPRALEQLRVDVNDWISNGSRRRVVILSRSPRSAYPVGDGSSLVLDSRDVHLHESRFADWIRSEHESLYGPLPEAANASRGLASKVLEALREGPPDVESIAADVACQTLVELGPSYIALLDEWALERGLRTVPAIDVPEWMQVELFMAGAAELDLDQQNLILFNRSLGKGWSDGLRSASQRCVSAPRDWRELAASLFELERLLRLIMLDAFEASLGRKWAKQILSEENATYIRQSAGVPEDFPLHQLANPLDYMTLGQLLDLVDGRLEMAATGLTPVLRLELRRVVPIRNRVGHMRLPRMGDLHTTRTTLRLLQLKVGQFR